MSTENQQPEPDETSGQFQELGQGIDHLAPLWKTLLGWVLPIAATLIVLGGGLFGTSLDNRVEALTKQTTTLSEQVAALSATMAAVDQIKAGENGSIQQQIQDLRVELKETREELKGARDHQLASEAATIREIHKLAIRIERAIMDSKD